MQLIDYMKDDKGKKRVVLNNTIINKYCTLRQFLSYIFMIRPVFNDIPHLKVQSKLWLAKGMIGTTRMKQYQQCCSSTNYHIFFWGGGVVGL